MPDSPTPPRRTPGSGGARRATPPKRGQEPPTAPVPQRPTGEQTHEIGNRTIVVADVEPLDVDGVRTLTIGCILWALATIALLPFYGRLEEDGNLWWLWTCVAGFGLGLYGLEYCRRRRKSRLRDEDSA
ncbi:hypothetical protein GCM10027425_14770 [Alteromonas gracilis]